MFFFIPVKIFIIYYRVFIDS